MCGHAGGGSTVVVASINRNTSMLRAGAFLASTLRTETRCVPAPRTDEFVALFWSSHA
jgi:hypothetical protein